MIIEHSHIKSPLFKLVDIYELDIEFGMPNDEIDSFSLRVELFVSLADSRLYRFRAYRTEMYLLRPACPVIVDVDSPENIAVSTLFVEHNLPHLPERKDFKADNPQQALKKIIGYLNKALKHVTSKEIECKY